MQVLKFQWVKKLIKKVDTTRGKNTLSLQYILFGFLKEERVINTYPRVCFFECQKVGFFTTNRFFYHLLWEG
jgi:hypothetical protein